MAKAKQTAPASAALSGRPLAIEHVAPSVLAPAPYNPRQIDDASFARLTRGIATFGLVDPIIARRSDGLVVGGHQRLRAATDLGLETVPVVYLDGVDDDQAAALNVLLNNPSAQGTWDMARLSGLLSELDGNGFDATLTGFDEDALANILTWTPEVTVEEADEAEAASREPPDDPKSVLGEVYQLGRHRLMCGDATSFEHVETLTAGAKLHMVYTDPPYGVAIVNEAGTVSSGLAPGPALRGKVGTIHRGMKAKPIIEANTYAPIIGDDSTRTAIDAYNLCAALKVPVLIFWGGNYYAEALPPSSCWIVWDKVNGESFFADAELAWTNQKTAVRIFKHQWNGLIKQSERGQKRVHPTQKPIALAEWCFEKYGEQGDNVLDLFGGSGSTLIAAEKTGRTAFLMEMSPAYCDVIRRRYAELVNRPDLAP